MKIAILLSLIAGAVAFAPVALKSAASSTSLKATFDDKPGALSPLGYWDPLNLATSEKLFDQFRAVELKHGRVAMLAVVGFVVPEFYRFGYKFTDGVTTADIRNGYQALRDVPPLGWVQMIMFVGFVDQSGFLGNFEMGKPDLSPEVLFKRQTQELQNGRLAMIATLELSRHNLQNAVTPGFDGLDNLITGLPFLYN